MSAHPIRLLMPVLLVPVMVLTGCGVVDPTLRPGTLTLDSAPTINAASMVADPYDMLHGKGSNNSDGNLAAAAVDRARTDTVKPLLSGEGGMTPGAASGGTPQ